MKLRLTILCLLPLCASALLPLPPAVLLQPAQGKEDNEPLVESYKLEAKGDYAGAAKQLKRMLEASPKVYFLHLRQAYLLLLAGERSKAADGYAAAARLAPQALEPLLGLQQSWIAMERWDAAVKAGRDVLACDGDNYLGLSRLAWSLYMQTEYKAAAEVYGRLLVLYPGDVDLRSGLGWSLLKLGQTTQAATAFRECLAMVPGHAGATSALPLCK